MSNASPTPAHQPSVTLCADRVLTMDPALDGAAPAPQSITIVRDRIAAVGSAAERGGALRVRLPGAVLLPGLIDSHVHLALGGESLLHLDLSGADSRPAFERRIAERHHALPRGRWLIASGWNEDGFKERTLPDRTWLAASGDRPTVCWRMDQHACVVNDAVLHQIGVDRLRQDPPGGRIGRDADGAASGLLQESAAWQLVHPLTPSPDAPERRAAVRAAHRHLASLGLTSVGSMEYAKSVREIIASELAEFRLRMRVTLLDREWPIDCSVASSLPDHPMLAVIGMKTFVDGTLGSRTARMLQEYADDPGNRGLFLELASSGHLLEWTRLVREAGLSPSMHAIGDEAARVALDAIDRSDVVGAPAVRVEHAQTLAAEDIPRFRGRFASMQPLHKAFDARTAGDRLGSNRMRRFFPFRSLLEAGARLAFGSDWPIVSPDPMLGMAAAITGRAIDGTIVRPEENLTASEALRAYTSEAAACLGLRDAGVLRAGSLADCTIVDRDPLACDWSRARPIVLATLVGGRVMFAAASLREELAALTDLDLDGAR